MIGSVPIHGDLILAPMAGYSDAPFRSICRAFGSAISYTPLLPDDAIVHAPQQSARFTAFFPEERPVAMQLLAKEESRMLAAADKLMEQQPDIIDLNAGCPVRKVSGKGRGAALLLEPERLARLASALARALPVPITVKIRLGWDDNSRNHVQVARMLEDSGVVAIAVHGRTREQAFSGRADWQAIAEVRAAVDIPVIANGDVRTVADIEAIKAVTGCPAVMIGRGAIGNPWIFARRDVETVPPEERAVVMRRHVHKMVAFYGEELGIVLFRKQAVRYVQALQGSAALRRRLVTYQTEAEVLTAIDEIAGMAPAAGAPPQRVSTEGGV
jgi:tRNA-dihydrouridine synthase B